MQRRPQKSWLIRKESVGESAKASGFVKSAIFCARPRSILLKETTW